MRGGPSLKGKGGLVGFRKTLKVQGRTGGFSKVPSLMVKKDGLILEKNFFNVKGGLVGFRKKNS